MSATVKTDYQLHKDISKAQTSAEKVVAYLDSIRDEDGEIDPQLLNDMIEGETELFECIDQLYERVVEKEILIEGIKVAQAALGSRKSRLDKSVESERTMILQLLDRFGIKKPVQRPMATFSVRVVPEKLDVVEESDVPAKYWVPQDPKLDTKTLLADLKELADKRAEVAAALKEGEQLKGDDFAIPGARLTDKGIGLTIRKK